jgi:DeoR family fructose operon transcriptional repressor
MLIEERHNRLLQVIRKNRLIAVNDLHGMLDISISTLRRDLEALEKQGKVRRIHGGVESLEDIAGRATEPTIAEKSMTNQHDKRLVAKAAVKTVQGGDVIFLDAGTTTGEMIPYLADIKPAVTVVTNSVHHAARLSDMLLSVIIIGGQVKQTTDAAVGGLAAAQIGQLSFDKSYIGANGANIRNGYTTPDIEEAVIKRLAIAQTKESFVLADGSKIGMTTFGKIDELTSATLITNMMSNVQHDEFTQHTKVIVAEEDTK